MPGVWRNERLPKLRARPSVHIRTDRADGDTPRVLVKGRWHDFLREIGLRQFLHLGRALQHVFGREGGAHQLAHPLRCTRDFLEHELGGDEPVTARLAQASQGARVGQKFGVEVTADDRRIEIERKRVHRRIHDEPTAVGRGDSFAAGCVEAWTSFGFRIEAWL